MGRVAVVRFRKRRVEKVVERVDPPATVRLLRTPEEIEAAVQRAAGHDAMLLEKIERRLKRGVNGP